MFPIEQYSWITGGGGGFVIFLVTIHSTKTFLLDFINLNYLQRQFFYYKMMLTWMPGVTWSMGMLA